MSKNKPTSPLAQPDLTDLPEGWTTCLLGDLASVSSGKFLSKGQYDQDKTRPFPVGGAGGPIGWTDAANVHGRVMTLGRVGACGVLSIYEDGVWATDNTLVVTPHTGGLFDPLRLYVQTVRWDDLQTGSSQPLITQTMVKAVVVPLPPLAEQKRIVAKVEALLARVNAARARLAKVPAILKRFRQSVLATACSGQLTADWRADHPTTASAERRRELLAKDREDQIKTNWRPGGRRTRARSPLHLSYNPVEETPAEWLWCTFDEGTTLITKGSSPGWQGFDYQTAGVLFVRSQNVRWGTVDLTDKTFLPQRFNDEHAGSIIHTNDVLLNLVGASIGRSAVAPDETDGANCNQAVGIIRPVSGHLLPRWAMWYLLSCGAQEHIASTKADVARANFNLDDIRPMPLVLPPITEQSEIVRRVEALFALADKIEARVQAATARVEKITQAILAKAFRGELVPTEAELARQQDRDYEPAAVLLERIRAARAKTEPSKREQRSRTRRPGKGDDSR
ncbi:MAG: restriction endonuclease subunit S [Planctomycetota bacterium]|jgi:type I restriction enzyme S subunit|nr:restriction endonuclease subunit S [Planctomycetota bacterium]